jgi:hypothetical protein
MHFMSFEHAISFRALGRIVRPQEEVGERVWEVTEV